MTITSSLAQCLPGHTATITCYAMRPAEPTNPSRAPRTLPRTHIFPQYPTTTPASSMLLHAVRTNHGNSNTSRPRPIPNSLRLPLCCYSSKFRLVFGMNDDFFSKMHSADGFEFCLLEAPIWVRLHCHAIHFTRSNNNTLFPPFSLQPYLFSPLQRCGFMSLAGVTSPRTGYHRDEVARVADVLFRSSNLVTTPLLLFLPVAVDVLWLLGV